jgi:hypothetical protein
MKTIGIALIAATLLGGCAVYADPYGASVYAPAPSVYIAPPPVVVAPRPYYGWYGPRYRSGGYYSGYYSRDRWHR